jgi:hypothetical protein
VGQPAERGVVGVLGPQSKGYFKNITEQHQPDSSSPPPPSLALLCLELYSPNLITALCTVRDWKVMQINTNSVNVSVFNSIFGNVQLR